MDTGLIHITGNTYMIPATTNIGVYAFADRYCVIVDSGSGRVSAKNILNILKANGFKLYGILNTHSHGDHCGGNSYLQRQTDCRVYATELETILIENPFLYGYVLHTARPPRVLRNNYVIPASSWVTDIITPGVLNIKNKNFEVLKLYGHTWENCGYRTPDGVLFVGDALIGSELLQEYKIFFLLDAKPHFRTLENLEQLDDHMVYAAHGGELILNQAIAENKKVIKLLMNEMLTEIEEHPLSQAELVIRAVNKRNLNNNRLHYYFMRSTIAALLTYFTDQKILESFMEAGALRYRFKQNY